jgi:vesicle-fusing ATPase
MHALDEVQPAFGVSEEELQQVVENGIIHYSQRVNVSLIFVVCPFADN